jgi:hypothetical protein
MDAAFKEAVSEIAERISLLQEVVKRANEDIIEAFAEAEKLRVICDHRLPDGSSAIIAQDAWPYTLEECTVCGKIEMI